MTNAENFNQEGCLQRDSTEHEEYAGAQSAGVREGKETDGAEKTRRLPPPWGNSLHVLFIAYFATDPTHTGDIVSSIIAKAENSIQRH